MPAPAQLTTCPHCGGLLTPVDVSRRPDTPPWLCGRCRLGLWNAETTAQAHQAWDPHTQTFHDPIVRAATHAEHDAKPGSLHHGRVNS